ncbi:MAG: DUF3108 domain-containing protein [Pseudomonadales bacterium]|nr:DUF3108 domain-containing protein [Pseudomonadales bacterium]
MAKHYLQPDSTTWTEAVEHLARPALLALWVATSLPLHATAAPPELQPYTAHYKTTARGIGMAVTRTLELGEGNAYVLTNGGKILVMGFHEVGVFHVEDEQVKPQSYVYQGSGLVNRRRELHFDREAGRIDSLYKDNWYQLPYSETTVDRMTQLEQLRLTLLAGDGEPAGIEMRVADGKRVKDSRLELVGEETLETPLGSIDTLHYTRLHDSAERSSDIWVAPQWDYLMVKTVHIEHDQPVEMVLTGASIGGVPVSAD